jgi:hypothetical protein
LKASPEGYLLSRTSPVARVVYAKRPFAGPEAVLAYLSRYTHRVAIANSRLIAFDDTGVTFRWKDYRAKGRERQKVMTLASDEFSELAALIQQLGKCFGHVGHLGSLPIQDDSICSQELVAVAP